MRVGTFSIGYRILFAVLLALPLICTPAISAAAGHPVRVGFIEPQDERLAALRTHVYYAGYLDELSKYMSWEYELVPVKPQNALQELRAGKIDLLMPVTYDIMARNEDIILTKFDYARTLLGLYASVENTSFDAEDLNTLKGARVGAVWMHAAARASYEAFCDGNGLDTTPVFFENREEMVRGLRRGDVDLILDTGSMALKDTQFLLGFDGIPVRIAALRSEAALIQKINIATWKLQEQNPQLASRYMNEFYERLRGFITHFSPAETTLIKNLPPQRIILVGELAPIITYPDGREAAPAGIYADLLDLIAQKSGLSFTYVYAEDYFEAWDMLRTGKADLLIDVYSNVSSNADFTYTNSMYDEPFAFLTKAENTHVTSGILALPIECPAVNNFMNHDMPQWQTKFNQDPHHALKEVISGRADAAIVSMSALQMEKLLTIYPNLVIVPNQGFKMPTNIAIAPGKPALLQSILNKAILKIDDAERNHIIMKNTTMPVEAINLEYMKNHYPLQFGLSIGALILLVSVLLGMVFYSRKQTAQRAVLEKKNGELAQALHNLQTMSASRDHYLIKSKMDDLTGVLNKQGFEEAVRHILGNDCSANRSHILLMFDLDHFKEANDAEGHPYGDAILKKFAQLLRDTVRDVDVVGRFGGDEFLICLRDIPECRALAIARHINEAVRSIDVAEDRPTISTSIGLARYPQDADSYEELLKRADEALYETKAQGRNAYTSYRDL